jgi:hypothetical protein
MGQAEEAPTKMHPVIAALALPLLYSSWQRRKRRMEALSDPQRRISAATRKALKVKDWSLVVGGVFAVIGSTIGILWYPTRLWVLPAILAFVALVVNWRAEWAIAKEMGS